MDTSVLENEITQCLKKYGFRKKGRNWYLTTDETISLINLQRSLYGPQFYMNIGICLRSELQDIFPKEHHCHIRGRLEALDCDPEQVKEALSFQHGPPSAGQIAAIIEILDTKIVPFLVTTNSIQSLKTKRALKELDQFLVNRIAISALDRS